MEESRSTDEQEYLDFLIQTGVLVSAEDTDEYGDPRYHLDIEAAELYAPEYHKYILGEIDNDLMHLYQEELVDFELNEKTFAIEWKITDTGKSFAKQLIEGLDA